MSFFVKGKPRIPVKRKFDNKSKDEKKNKKLLGKNKDEQEEEEIHSDDEHIENVPGDAAATFALDEEDFIETPQDKRLRIAQKYLKEVQEAERGKAEDFEIHGQVSQRLKNEYLDSIGRLHRNVAHKYQGFDLEHSSVLKYKHQKLSITCVCLTEDDKFLFVGNKNGIIVKWDLEKKERVAVTKSQKFSIECMDVSHDQKYLAVADGTKNIKICCADTLNTLNELEGHTDVVTSIVFRKNTHQLYSASKDRTIKVWSLTEMAYVETLYGHQSAITSIDALSREKAISAGGNDKSIRIWKIVEESQLVYEGHTDSIECVKLIGDEHFVSCGSDGSLCVWGTSKKKPLCSVKFAHGKTAIGEPNWISSIATLINTDIIASGSCDGMVRVWKLENKNRQISLLFEIPIEGFVNALAFNSDGTKLIAGVGQEHKLGRWWKINGAKNSTVVIPFVVDKSKSDIRD